MASLFSKVQYNYYEILKVILFILAIVFVVWISPKESFFRYEFQQGKPWNHNDLIAPFDFSILKTEKQISEERTLMHLICGEAVLFLASGGFFGLGMIGTTTH